MEQFLMLKTELNNGKREVDGMKTDIKSMQQELKAQEMMIQRSMPKILVSCLLRRKQKFSFKGKLWNIMY